MTAPVDISEGAVETRAEYFDDCCEVYGDLARSVGSIHADTCDSTAKMLRALRAALTASEGRVITMRREAEKCGSGCSNEFLRLAIASIISIAKGAKP
jgi:hypothetical protein